MSVEVFRTDDGLELRRAGEFRGASLDLTDVRRRQAQGSRLALARACGARRGRSVLDAMAGFGTDGVLLACLGCDVTMVEGSDAIHAVLVDGVARARAQLAPTGAMRCVYGDGLDLLRGEEQWDVVYLDPMFPERNKGALPRRPAQLLADVARQSTVTGEILRLARNLARDRVVVKRRARDPRVAPPDWQIAGNRIRFDVYRARCGSGA